MMRKVLLAIAFVAFLTPVVFAQIENSPWVIPAEYRYIYQIDKNQLTSNQDVYVEINIPEAAYGSILDHLNDQWICTYINKNATDELYPRFFYLSTANTTQRHKKSYETIETYSYDVSSVCGSGKVLYLPKRVRLSVGTLDGGTSWQSIDHYIIAYFGNYKYETFSFSYNINILLRRFRADWVSGRSGLITAGGLYDSSSYSGWIVLPINKDLTNTNYIFLFTDYDYRVNIYLCLRLIDKQGRSINVAIGTASKCENIDGTDFGSPTESYVLNIKPSSDKFVLLNPYITMATGYNISDFQKIDKMLLLMPGRRYLGTVVVGTV